MFAYQIKGNEAHNSMLENILHLLLYTPLTPGVGSKDHFFSFLKVVTLHIKLTGMKHRTPCKQIFCPFIYPPPLDGFEKSKHFLPVDEFEKSKHFLPLDEFEKSKHFLPIDEFKKSKHFLPLDEFEKSKHFLPLNEFENSKHFFSEKVLVHNKLQGKMLRALCNNPRAYLFLH